MKQEQLKEFGKWFEQLESPLIAYAFQILKDREEARDQVQEAFRRMLHQDVEIYNPKAWLYRTLHNLSISQLRRKKRLQNEGEEKQLDFFAEKMDGEIKVENPLQKMERSEKVGRVAHFISLLPEESSNLIKMKFEEKLSYKQMADRTGLSVGNIGFKLHHLLRNLASELKAEGITE